MDYQGQTLSLIEGSSSFFFFSSIFYLNSGELTYSVVLDFPE